MKKFTFIIGSTIALLVACGQKNSGPENSHTAFLSSDCNTVFGWSSYGITDSDVVFIPRGKSIATDWYASWGMTKTMCFAAMRKCKLAHREYPAGCKIQYSKSNASGGGGSKFDSNSSASGGGGSTF